MTDASQYYARKRRRKKQDQKAFDIAGFFATPFDFGATAAAGSSANVLTLPADIQIALELNVAIVAGGFGVEDVTAALSYVSAEAGIAGGRVNIRQVFRGTHQIRITRAAGTPAGAVIVYFRGPKSQLSRVATATFT
jgi:hypothetical protein